MNYYSRQRGEISAFLVPFILVTLLFIGAATFGLWAFMERNDYKNNTDQKIAEAVVTAKQEEGIQKDKAFAEAEKNPLKTYVGPEAYGSVQIAYPKTWSGYVKDTGAGSQPLDGFFHPGVVPTAEDIDNTFALRIQVVGQSYSSVVTTMNNAVKTKQVTAVPFSFPKVPGEIGTRYEGLIQPGKKTQGSLIVIPLRDKTLKVWSESPTFLNDFNTHIVPNVSFIP